jgi:hypothetical protein
MSHIPRRFALHRTYGSHPRSIEVLLAAFVGSAQGLTLRPGTTGASMRRDKAQNDE